MRDGAAHLAQAMASVIAQKGDGVEYLLIDGGSRDGSVEIIRSLESGVDGWVSEPDGGIYEAMNKGLQRARGRFVAFLNADDWYEPGFLERLRPALQFVSDGTSAPVYYCDAYVYDETLATEFKVRRAARLQPWRGMTVSHQALFVPRGWYQALGGFDPAFRFAADFEFLRRLLDAGARFVKLDLAGVNFRVGGASTRHMNRSIDEVAGIVRRRSGRFSRDYLRFLLGNRLPSRLAALRRLLEKLVGPAATRRLRRWKQGVGRSRDWVPVAGDGTGPKGAA